MENDIEKRNGKKTWQKWIKQGGGSDRVQKADLSADPHMEVHYYCYWRQGVHKQNNGDIQKLCKAHPLEGPKWNKAMYWNNQHSNRNPNSNWNEIKK